MNLDFSKPRHPDVKPGPATSSAPLPTAGGQSEVVTRPPRRVQKLWHLYGGIVLGFLGFYVLASYTAFTASALSPGQVIFSNSLIQLWTASYRLAFILALVLVLIKLFWPELYLFFRPDVTDGPDLSTALRTLPSTHQTWLFVVVFFGLCALFVALLGVNPVESVSVGP